MVCFIGEHTHPFPLSWRSSTNAKLEVKSAVKYHPSITVDEFIGNGGCRGGQLGAAVLQKSRLMKLFRQEKKENTCRWDNLNDVISALENYVLLQDIESSTVYKWIFVGTERGKSLSWNLEEGSQQSMWMDMVRIYAGKSSSDKWACVNNVGWDNVLNQYAIEDRFYTNAENHYVYAIFFIVHFERALQHYLESKNVMEVEREVSTLLIKHSLLSILELPIQYSFLLLFRS